MDFLVAQKERGGEEDHERRLLVNSIFSPGLQMRNESNQETQKDREFTG